MDWDQLQAGLVVAAVGLTGLWIQLRQDNWRDYAGRFHEARSRVMLSFADAALLVDQKRRPSYDGESLTTSDFEACRIGLATLSMWLKAAPGKPWMGSTVGLPSEDLVESLRAELELIVSTLDSSTGPAIQRALRGIAEKIGANA